MKSWILISAIILSSVLSTGQVFAGKNKANAHVTRIIISDGGTFGGCMALLDVDVAAVSGLNCTNWVSFSCSGEYNSKDIAYRKLDIAQKSEVTGHKAIFFIDDSKKHNGHCYAYRVDSRNIP